MSKLLSLIIFFVALFSGQLRRALCLNLAHIGLMRWGAQSDAESGRYLQAAVYWGRRAGALWRQDAQGHNQRAEVLFDHYMANDLLREREQAKDWYIEGQTYEDAGQLELALRAYQRASANLPQRVEVNYKIKKYSG